MVILKRAETSSINNALPATLLKVMTRPPQLLLSGNSHLPISSGVIGRKAGATAFPYSKSMKGAGFTWSEKHLFVFLKNPSKYVVGTKMAFAGLENETERADLIAYLANN